MIRSLLLACLLAVAPAGLPLHATTKTHVVVSAYTYFPGDDTISANIGGDVVTGLVVPQGATVMLTNLDVNLLSHSFTADELGSNGLPLFDSQAVLTRASAPVEGITTLAPGVYGFHCRLHDWKMHGYVRIV